MRKSKQWKENVKLKEFLKELAKLSEKYNIYIDGCGCCGSPYLTTEEYTFASTKKDTIAYDLHFYNDTKEYRVNYD